MSRSTVPEEISTSMMPTKAWDIVYAAMKHLNSRYDHDAQRLLLAIMRQLCDQMEIDMIIRDKAVCA